MPSRWCSTTAAPETLRLRDSPRGLARPRQSDQGTQGNACGADSRRYAAQLLERRDLSLVLARFAGLGVGHPHCVGTGATCHRCELAPLRPDRVDDISARLVHYLNHRLPGAFRISARVARTRLGRPLVLLRDPDRPARVRLGPGAQLRQPTEASWRIRSCARRAGI